MKNYKEHIFRSIGNVLYAISKDRKPSPIARAEIRILLGEIWFADTTYGPATKPIRAPKVISLTLESLANQKVSADEAYENFENFYTSFPQLFPLEVKEKILETAEAVLRVAPAGPNPNKYMEALQLLLQAKTKKVLSHQTSLAESV